MNAVSLVRALVVFRPTTTFGKTAPVIIAVLLTSLMAPLLISQYVQASRDGYYNQGSKDEELVNIAFGSFGMPLIPALAASPQKRIKVYIAFFFFLNLFEVAINLCYTYYVLPKFFDPETTELVRFIIRSALHSALLLGGTEGAWTMNKFLVQNCGVETYDAHIVFAATASLITFYSRIMQGSATSLSQSLMFEFSGTISELLVADALLRGATPIRDNVEMMKSVTLNLFSKFNVAPSPQADDDSGAANAADDEATNEQRRKFCSSALVILSIAEGTNMVSSTLYWMLNNSNPGAAGSNSIPLSQTMTNLAVMLFGELVVTDGIVAYLAHNFERYKNDPAEDWAEMKKKKKLLAGCAVCIACASAVSASSITTSFCYTSWAGEGVEDWVITSCPAFPKNITEMSRVGETFQEEWEKFN
jgi:hypothetical protein